MTALLSQVVSSLRQAGIPCCRPGPGARHALPVVTVMPLREQVKASAFPDGTVRLLTIRLSAEADSPEQASQLLKDAESALAEWFSDRKQRDYGLSGSVFSESLTLTMRLDAQGVALAPLSLWLCLPEGDRALGGLVTLRRESDTREVLAASTLMDGSDRRIYGRIRQGAVQLSALCLQNDPAQDALRQAFQHNLPLSIKLSAKAGTRALTVAVESLLDGPDCLKATLRPHLRAGEGA